MTMFFDNSSHDWSVLLDELKQKEGIPSDAKLAAELGVTGSYICSVRKGRKRLSVELARVVLSRLGKSFGRTDGASLRTCKSSTYNEGSRSN